MIQSGKNMRNAYFNSAWIENRDQTKYDGEMRRNLERE